MTSRTNRRKRGDTEEESYFISMADMMVGLVFVFIILLVYFAMQYQQKSKALSDGKEARKELLEELVKEITRRDPKLVNVKGDPETGVLRIPENILFARGEWELLKPDGEASVITVAAAMAEVLPCYTRDPRRETCRNTAPGRVDAIFIEGHADTDPKRYHPIVKGNLELSALRATNTYRAMTEKVNGLKDLKNSGGQPVLSVSGYGEHRQIDWGQTDEEKARNRRIDLRFLMEAPKDENLSGMLERPQ